MTGIFILTGKFEQTCMGIGTVEAETQQHDGGGRDSVMHIQAKEHQELLASARQKVESRR